MLRLESDLLRFFEQFGSVLRSQFSYVLDERCFLHCIDLGRRSGTCRNRCPISLKNSSWPAGEQMQGILTGFDEALCKKNR